MNIVDIYCPECDYDYDTPEVIPGQPPSCPKCGEVHTRFTNKPLNLVEEAEVEIELFGRAEPLTKDQIKTQAKKNRSLISTIVPWWQPPEK